MILAVIGENTRITTRKDMEYSDGQMDMYIMDNGNRIIKMAMDITEMQMAENTMDSSRMTRDKEKES